MILIAACGTPALVEAAPFAVTTLTLLLLLLAGFSGGFIDAVAGGGGLITMPALLACGLTPQMALGTNKLQSSCGTTLAVWRYTSAGLMRTPRLWLAIGCALIASAGGALAVSALDKALLQKLMPWMLATVAVYTALNPRFGLHEGRQKMGWVPFAALFGIVLGFYDGFFGPGAGTFWTVACVMLLGLDLRRATAYTKAANLASNLGSLVIFLSNGSVHFTAAAAMIAGQVIGAQAGAGFVIKHGAKFIRPVFLVVVFALTAKLIWDALKR